MEPGESTRSVRPPTPNPTLATSPADKHAPTSPLPAAITPAPSSIPPVVATPAPSSTLNPNAEPFRSAGSNVAQRDGELPPWLTFSPSSSESEDLSPRPTYRDVVKGKQPLVASPE